MKYLRIVILILICLPAFAQDSKNVIVKEAPKKRAVAKPILIRGPYLQIATPTSMVVRWRTDALARSRVRYGTDLNNLSNTADDNSLVTEHIVKVSGLSPRTKYYYSIGGLKDTLQGDSSNYFMTLPVAGHIDKYRIGIFGDCGHNSTTHRNSRDQFIKYLGNNYLDSWILLGDNAYPDGEDAQYQTNFFNIHKDNLLKKYPLFPAPGNHDYHDVEFSKAYAQKTHDVAYYQNFSMPVDGESGGVASGTKSYYSFDIGNIHFLSLDSYGQEEDSYRLYDTLSPQVQWVKKDLEANKNKGWVVAYWHHPPYTMGTHNSDKETELVKIRENFVRILERYGVDLILCGHSHNYERSKLMKGYYGMEDDFDAQKYNLSQSSGMYDGSDHSCPYIKKQGNNGIVYVVSGAAGGLGLVKPSFPHEALPFAYSAIGGASILEVEGNRLDVKWICTDGVIRDKFTMMKDVNQKHIIKARKGERVTLKASYVGSYKWNKGKENSRSIQVVAEKGAKTYTVTDEFNCVKDVFEVVVSK